jgi:GxxExxY protein
VGGGAVDAADAVAARTATAATDRPDDSDRAAGVRRLVLASIRWERSLRASDITAMGDRQLIEERLTRSIIGAFFDVYNALGFGFLEQIYARAMEQELRARGHRVAREVSVVVRYRGEAVGVHRLGMVVDKLVIETKTSPALHPQSWRQVYSYLRATELEVGLLLHFGQEPRFHRVIHQRARRAD